MASKADLSYPGKVALKRTISAARELGIDVAGFEVSPDGTIRIMEARAMSAPPAGNLFDKLDAAGLI